MRSKISGLFAFALVVLFLCVSALPVYAEDGGDGEASGEASSDSLWGQVFNPDGSLRSDLIDKGVVTQEVDWMPHIPFIGPMKAEYHVYVTQNGTTVVMPTATTLFFMAMHPNESGLNQSAGMISNGSGLALVTAGQMLTAPEMVFAQVAQELGVWEYVSPDQFADAVIAGRGEVWSLGGDIFNIFKVLAQHSGEDMSYYTTFLVYPPSMCHQAPGGCPPEVMQQVALSAQPTPAPSECAQPSIKRGEISAQAQLLDPPHPLVVGQDPTKRGVDLEFRLTIGPTIYTWYEAVEQHECVYVADGSGAGCPGEHAGNPYYQYNTWIECVPHQVVYQETAQWVVTQATLGEQSRQWILNQLSVRYPGAYLHHPDWTWTNPPAQSGFQGDTFVWTARLLNVPVADPGRYGLTVAGKTSGTPVTEPRSFSIQAGEFPVHLITSTLKR